MSDKENDKDNATQIEHPEPAVHSDNQKSAVPPRPEDKRAKQNDKAAENAEPPVG